ncbi:hypothetical protein LKMONMHP_3585 [Methylobacterium organophilum]|uniref:M23ase beta-sheet core domain-containing protein n=1 Tax=Methylobacterium organophilum TaxID=410 RepID=A0ABQ4TEF0_METOR|nr:hypothetical protein LKMONMHP_3585 [Methylobacterium organophilum]
MPSVPSRHQGPRGATAGRRSVWPLRVALAASTLWAGAASYYLVFHDEVLARFMAQQTALRTAYEARIDTLRHELDRRSNDARRSEADLASRLTAIAERQRLLERRQATLSGLGSALPEGAETAPEPDIPLSHATAAPAPGAPEAQVLRGRDDRADRIGHDPGPVLANVERRLDGLSAAQFRFLATVTARSARSAGRFRDLIAGTGLDLARYRRPTEAMGGPLVPLPSDAFSVALAEARRQVDEEVRMRRLALDLPLRKPLPGDPALTSSFGSRLDPFTRGYALHTGIDLRAEAGEPVRATAPGRVTAAEYAGGYGNMVEVDHGQGVLTRYAHLSGYAVSPGQRIAAGTVLGYAGSTGRSTGSHLHYETRIDGEPVDPMAFLKAGAQLEFPD